MSTADVVADIMAGLTVVDGRVAWPRPARDAAHARVVALPRGEGEEVALLLLASVVRLHAGAGEDAADACAALVDLVVDLLPADVAAQVMDGMLANVQHHEEKIGGARASRVPVKADASAGESPMGVRFPGLARRKR